MCKYLYHFALSILHVRFVSRDLYPPLCNTPVGAFKGTLNKKKKTVRMHRCGGMSGNGGRHFLKVLVQEMHASLGSRVVGTGESRGKMHHFGHCFAH